jgi:tetratricopeptide (TPR) repeat protein
VSRRRALALLGLALALAGALRHEAPAQEGPPLSPEHRRARELSWSGDYGRSLALYADLLAARPGDRALELETGRVLLWAGREAEALARCERVLALAPGDAEARLCAARALAWQGRPREAAPHYRLALPAVEEDGAVVAEAVGVLRQAGRSREAERWLAEGLERHPEHPDLLLARARAELEAGRFEAARRRLEAIQAAHPEHRASAEELALLRGGRARVALAERLGHAGRYGPAKRRLREHLRERPEDEEAHLLLARFAAWSGDYGLADREYRHLLEARPRERELRHELADVASWRGRYDDALARYGELRAEDPLDLRARLGVANVLLWSGAHRQADRDLREILALDPEHEGARRQLGHLDQLRAQTVLPSVSWFRDSDGFTLFWPQARTQISPRPGRTLALELDAPQAEGELFEVDPVSGAAVRRSERSSGYGFRLAWLERPDRFVELGGELGAVDQEGGGVSPRARLFGTWFADDRNAFQAELLHEDALPAVRTIRSALEGIERSALHLVHSYRGERLSAWTRLEGGRFSDDPSYWMARSVLGLSLVERPLEVDLLALGTAGGFDERSPNYYSPEDLLHYGVGLRLKKSLPGRADFLLIGELGRIHEDGSWGDTLRIAPELRLELGPRLELSLRYDHYRSQRQGSRYESDFASAQLTWRFPVQKP